MERNLPSYITSEQDLIAYEKYLKNGKRELCSEKKQYHMQIETPKKTQTPEILSNPIFFQCYLKKHIGKLIKAESLIGNRLENRMGTLIDVGSDYIVIKPTKHCVTTMINLKSVKYISIIHDNDRSKAGNI